MKKLLPFLFYVNIIAVILTILHVIIRKEISPELNSQLYNIRLFMALLTLIFVIQLMIVWSKFDKKPIRFILLLFLLGWYSIYYFIFARKSGWINRYLN